MGIFYSSSRFERLLLIHADLLEHSELIPVVPALNDPSVDNAGNRNSSAAHGPATRGQPWTIPGMSHDARPAQNDLVAGSKYVFDFDLDIRKRAANLTHEFRKFLWPANFRFP